MLVPGAAGAQPIKWDGTDQLEARVVAVMFGFMPGRHMLGADQLFALIDLQVNIEAP